ncbi:T9SS C-terminal target domain-containing protein, partial [candidate division KSB1 bacterium]
FACSLFATSPTGGSPYGKVAVFANCPTEATEPCLAQSVSNYVGPYGFICQGPYAAGTYYIMVDNYAPGPDCINYTLKVFTCACPTPCPYDNRDTEPNDACAETVPAIVCGESLCGVISTSTDVDWYQLVIPEGVCDSVTIEAFANDTPTEWPYGRGLESYLNLYKSDCITQIAYNDDRGGSPYNDDAKIGKVYLKSGTYYIKVSRGGYTTSEIGPYVLRVTCETAECPLPCEEYVLCGLPGEVEVNNTCPPPVEQPEVTCDVPVYGLHCPYTDVDFWKVTVPPQTIMKVKVYTGPLCTINPAAGVQFRYYDDACLNPSAAVTGTVTLSNMTDLAMVKYLEVYDVGESQTLYKIEATCCQVKNYCFDPIDIQDGPTSFDMTVNTCCATRTIDSVRSISCSEGYWYDSGPAVMFKFELRYNALVNITVTGITMTDVQFMVFTNCMTPEETCVASRDNTTPEVLTGLSLPAGTYYLGVMVYDGSIPYDNCGDIRVQITSDVPLPVNLLGDVVASAGSEKVTLNWATASENENDRFEIVRDNRVVGVIAGAGMSPTTKEYSWTEDGLNNNTTYTYKLRSVTTAGTVTELATVSATPSFAAGAVTEYALHQNYPNPFNPVTSIAFDLLENGFVTLKVYNLMGQEVKTVVSSTMDAGRHIVSFDASNLSSGLYLYRVEVNGFAAEKKMLLMK